MIRHFSDWRFGPFVVGCLGLVAWVFVGMLAIWVTGWLMVFRCLGTWVAMWVLPYLDDWLFS